MKVALCTISRLENRYIREFVEYYKDLGVDTIFINDNNYDGEERFEDVIWDYIDSGFVQIIDYRNKSYCQLEAYQLCYDTNKSNYDWMIFADSDEFLTFTNKDMKVKDYLSQSKFLGYDMIHINLLYYGDNDLVYYEDKPVLERFKLPIMPLDFNVDYDFAENNHVSSIVRCGTEISFSHTPHTPLSNCKCCDSVGKVCDANSPFCDFTLTEAYFRHYSTKTIEEFLYIKAKRGFPDVNKDWFVNHNPIEYFFKRNRITKEKIRYIKENNIIEGNTDIFICTHKDFDNKLYNDIYKVIDSRFINHDINTNGIKGKYYAELFHYMYVADNLKLKKYVGFCHYSKSFAFMNNVPNMDAIFSKYDVIASELDMNGVTNRELYDKVHNIEDLYIVGDIINKKYPKYIPYFENMLNSDKLFRCNMFVMRSHDFLDYIEFIKNILDDYLEYIGYDIEKRISSNKEKYNERIHGNAVLGLLAERLTDVYIRRNFVNVLHYDIVFSR